MSNVHYCKNMIEGDWILLKFKQVVEIAIGKD